MHLVYSVCRHQFIHYQFLHFNSILIHRLRKGVVCDYPHRRKRRELRKPSSEASTPVQSPAKPTDQDEGHAERERSNGNKVIELESSDAILLSERFLDPELFEQAQLELPKLHLDSLLTDEHVELVGNVRKIQETAEHFFKTIHVWMPIISRIQFSRLLLNRLSHKRTELFLLVLSMKLCSARTETSRTALYRTTKQLSVDVESCGALSLPVLQANVLITLYEFGHGIYPAAFHSVAQCARYATAIGVDKTICSKQRNLAHKWDDLEECRRVWWSILVLDR